MFVISQGILKVRNILTYFREVFVILTLFRKVFVISQGIPKVRNILKCLWQIFFYFLVRFYIRFWGEKRKIFFLTIFLHRVLAVWKREISLPVGSKTASRGKLGIVVLWRVTGNTLTTKEKEKWEIVGTILVNSREIPVYFFVKAR